MESKTDLDRVELDQTLKDFRSSVHAWSESAYAQPHRPAEVYHTTWRVAAGWALGCVLAVGSLAGGVYEHHQVKERARLAAAAEAARQQKLQEDQRKLSDELAKIDGDVSREVPSAMEPLAQLMMEDSAQ